MIRITILPVILLVILIITGIFLLSRKKRLFKVLGVFLILVSIAAIIEGIYLYVHSMRALKVIANQTTEITTYGIYVLEDAKIEDIKGLENKTVGFAKDITTDDLSEALKSYTFNLSSYSSQLELIEGLKNEECDGAVLSTSYINMLEENDVDEGLGVQLRLLEEISIEKVIENPVVITPEEPFVVYISGKDTWGHISVPSRSDVNILAAVNPETKHILLVSTPRDYYVPLSIAGGAMDKLTHTGIYGIDVSEETMENLYGIDIDHYFKVNFSGFEGLINAMGGITVWSDYEFDVENIGHFSKGENHMMGLQALAFARERYSFPRGDLVRGENQMNVIQSVVQKMTSKSVLKNYGEILKECDGTFATDISTGEIADLVAYQLSNPGEWNIEKLSVGGTGAHQSVYSLGKRAYVMNPSEEDINNARERIQEVLDEE
ncbi:transcriptional attenuator, LytR family [Pseudobutyrivibrio xylanivorans DSM 14809]|uniref:Transcriptional attenuator, LytR family n=1 Tax=Pseudobutyrivibrio xylanivorans DSM 14809 TaxID=1123012 RepID=A0A1M6JB34_PSEXY|nr:transcriptional attenuator, LytR family [Pseudobutyrivibrio xylanivorans DSM 14809]